MLPATVPSTPSDRDNSLYLPGAGDPVGRRFRFDPSLDPLLGGFNTITRSFANVNASTASVYLSFLLKVESAPTSTAIPRILSLTGNGTPACFFGIASTTTPGTGQVVWHRTLSDPFTFGPLIPLNQTVFVVIQSQNDPAGPGSGVARLWINPPRGVPTPPTQDSQISSIAAFTISLHNTLSLSTGPMSGNVHEMDNIRVGLSWADVTPFANAASVAQWEIY